MAGFLNELWLLATLVVTAVWYWRGARGARLGVVPARRRSWRVNARGVWFGCGLLAIAAALLPPLEPLTGRYLWAHMLQHVLLMMLAPPLLVLGAPWMAFWRPLPLRFRRSTARALGTSPTLAPVRRALRSLAGPLPAWLLFNLNLGLWHVPSLYDLTVRNLAVHYLEHASLVLLGVLFWAQVIDSPPLHAKLEPFGRAVYLTSASVAGWLLAVVLALAPTPLYGAYAHPHGALSPLADQQLAAGVMWGPGSIPYAIAVFYFLYVWLGVDESGERRTRRRALAASGTSP